MIEDYLSLFPGSTREKARFMELAEAVLRQVTDLQAVVAFMNGAFSFAEAEGKQLDLLAESVGLSRADTAAGSKLHGRAVPAVPPGQAGPLGMGRNE